MSVAQLCARGLSRYSAPSVLPEGVSRSFAFINKVHWIWRMWRIGQEYRESSLTTVLAITAFQITFKNSELVERIAQFALGTRRLLACADGVADFYYAYVRLKEIIRDDFPTYEPKLGLIESIEQGKLLPQLEKRYERVSRYVQDVAKGIFELACRSFILSMLTLDAIDAFYLSPASRAEAMEKLPKNVDESLKLLKKDLEVILKKLESNREFLNWVLREGRTGFEVSDVINGVNAVLSVSIVVDTVVETVKTAGEGLLDGFFKMISPSTLMTEKSIVSASNMLTQSPPPSPSKSSKMGSISSSEMAVPSSSLSLKQIKNLRAVLYLN